MLWKLFLTFARIGGLTFGGGYAMMPMIQKEVVEKNQWATDKEVMDYYALGQCAPGIIATNTAAFIGYSVRGVPGALAAVTGAAFPSFVIIVIISGFIQNFASNQLVQSAFAGIRVAVVVLVIQAIVKLWKSGIKDFMGIILFGAAFVASFILQVSPIMIVVGAIVLGVLLGRKGAKA